MISADRSIGSPTSRTESCTTPSAGNPPWTPESTRRARVEAANFLAEGQRAKTFMKQGEITIEDQHLQSFTESINHFQLHQLASKNPAQSPGRQDGATRIPFKSLLPVAAEEYLSSAIVGSISTSKIDVQRRADEQQALVGQRRLESRNSNNYNSTINMSKARLDQTYNNMNINLQ